MSKRISALLLAVVLTACSVLNGNTLKVKAASVAVSEDFAVELTMMLYNLLETASISSGIKDGLDDYESGSSLYDAFLSFMDDMATPPFYDSYITMADGSRMTIKEAMDAVDSTLGSNALKLPTSEAFAKYRVISGTGGSDPEPTPTPDPENSPAPDTGYKDPFTYIQNILVAGTLVAAMGDFFKDLYDGKVEGLAAEDYYTGLGFTGKLDQDADGNYIVIGSFLGINSSNYYTSQEYIVDSSFSSPVVCIYTDRYFAFLSSSDVNKYFSLPLAINYYRGTRIDKTFRENISSKTKNGYSFEYNLNIPVFNSDENARIFLQTGEVVGLLNGEAYDFRNLTKSVPTVMQPLTGYEFAPGRLPGINAALSTAAAALPEPGLDPAENTEAYKNALNAALTAALPEPAPEPEPEPDPSPDPGTDGEGESYKRDLRLIFPFCIPFDFIHFIQALSADPVAPCFKIPIKLDSLGIDMVLELSLAWMDPVMEIFRLGELGCFVIMLMAATKKMIGW